MTLADEYTNTVLTVNANRAFQGNVATCDTTWWPTLEPSNASVSGVLNLGDLLNLVDFFKTDNANKAI